MNRSICKTIPDKNGIPEIQPVNFVYETEFKKMKQPFKRNIHYIHIVSRGSGILKANSERHNLTIGSAFIAFPFMKYEIDASHDFEYIYISYTGTSADSMTKRFAASDRKYVYHNFDKVLDFWKETIRRITSENAGILTECALYYALSHLNDNGCTKKDTDSFEGIIEYIDKNFTDTDISVKKVAGIFSYSEKYLSSLFKKNMDITFSRYINSLRISYSLKLIENGKKSISEIARKCGFTDSFYFSKVFKKTTGVSPTQKVKETTGKK